MKIFGPTSLTGSRNILSGYYAWAVTGLNKPKLFELSSPSFPIQNFQLPYDATVIKIDGSGMHYMAAGRRLRSYSDPIYSDRSGAFYYFNTPTLIGTCHGYGRDDLTYYSGYNFYHAFYPAGYIAPPYGETPTLHKLNSDGFDNLNQGACFSMSVTEYNEQYGILSKVASDAGVTSDMLKPGAWSLINPQAEVCPDGTVAVTTYYDEVQARRIPGTVTSLAAPTLYNHNPIPTPLDNYDNMANGRYQFTQDKTDPHNVINNITFGADGRPLSSYSSGDGTNSRLNNVLCYAQLFETDTMIGKLTNGMQRLDTPDVLYGSVGSQVSSAGAEPWHYWHFTFRENADTYPFRNSFKQIRPGITFRTISEGTQLFTPILSSEDYFWQNRQCPDGVDFLPWTMGASIYACPSEHFDIPYYAATRKFGFYGTRFLNACTSLNLANTWNGVRNALELPQNGPASALDPETEPDGIDQNGSIMSEDGSINTALYDNLIKVAKAEERYSNFYAMNKGFFFWANTGCLTSDPDWQLITGTFDGVSTAFGTMVNKFQQLYTSGMASLFSGEPKVIMQSNAVTAAYNVVDSGFFSELLFSNNAYETFLQTAIPLLSGSGVIYWNNVEKRYGDFVSNCSGSINSDFYKAMLSGREKRIRTRYFENVVRGNPIDLFPLNHITFSSELARDVLESTGWGRIPFSFGKGSRLPPINRRYFEGAYGNASAASGVALAINNLGLPTGTSFYPGFFNNYNFGRTYPTPHWTAVTSGYIQDASRRRYAPSGWLALGYGEVGALDKNFSCFTPIFVQQPLDKVFCKIGARPTFRSYAVDYHTIPEDKLSFRYPEIIYWAYKLKIIDSNFNNLYPMKYHWFRVQKTKYGQFVRGANFALADWPSITGSWYPLEGDGHPTCTLIHPKECVPTYANVTEDAYTFLQGAKKGIDDTYYYLCLAQGRFGVRISEPSELVIENWLRFDISHKNGMNKNGNLTVKFIINDVNGYDNKVTFTSEKQSAAYNGYQQDPYAIPEGVVDQKVPPPNAGFGDVSASRFVGPTSYVGATRSYSPDTLMDTRGLRERWGHMIDYGALVPFSKYLSQNEGNWLYGYQHLPQCTNYTMANGQKGVRMEAYVEGNKVSHWTLGQQAYASTDSSAGMQWNKMGNNYGSLYPPAQTIFDITSPNLGVGHWQWGNNLGAIKRFGWLSQAKDNDLVLLGRGVPRGANVPDDWMLKIKMQFVTSSTLAGKNCGYTKYGLGRNMLYYIEAFDRFYLICDPVKKKNVQNISFMCPGLRGTNSAIQYFWMGQPSNTYVERRAMFGPYAYQWRVRRHNRDRNGNGMSRGFYSYGMDTNFEYMYDAPAIYGLYVKRSASPDYIQKVQNVIALRKKIFGTVSNIASFRSLWFGEAGSEGTAGRYGNFTFSCDPTAPFYNVDMCNYVSAAKDLANALDFTAYNCPPDVLNKGQCFDPCLSIRYSHGFFPGGKSQSMFGYQGNPSPSLGPTKNVRLVSQANFKSDAILVNDEASTVQGSQNTYFRSPINTPHARVWRGLMKIDSAYLNPDQLQGIVGISPCRDGGADHCNYITPTLHMDNSSSLIGLTTQYINSLEFAANTYAAFEMRGGEE